MSDKSCAISSCKSSPKSKLSSRTQRQISCLDSHFASNISSTKRDQEQNEMIACLMQELKESRARQNNLKRINNTLTKALESEGKIILQNSQQKQITRHQVEEIENQWKSKLLKEQQQCEHLKRKLQEQNKVQVERSLTRQESSKSIESGSSVKSQRQQSVRNMQQLMESIVKEKCSLKTKNVEGKENSWGNLSILGDKTQNFSSTVRNPTRSKLLETAKFGSTNGPLQTDINQLVMHLVNQKIQSEMKIHEVENELRNKNLNRKQRDLLDASLKTLRKSAKSDQYQQYLKEKIIKQIDRFSTRIVLTNKRVDSS